MTRKNDVRTLMIVAAALILTACNQQQLMNYFIPKGEAALGQQYLEERRSRRFDDIARNLDPKYNTAQTHQLLEKMTGYFPNERVLSVKVVGSRTFTVPAVRPTT